MQVELSEPGPKAVLWYFHCVPGGCAVLWYFQPLIGVMETANGGRHKAMPPPGRAQALGAGTCECAPSLPHPIEPRPTGARGRAG